MRKQLKSWKEFEFEMNLLNKCTPKSLNHLSIGQILECIAIEIEECMIVNRKANDNFYTKLIKKYRYKSFQKQAGWTPKWKFPIIPEKNEDIPFEDSLLRLKTAMTAFKLHTGSLSNHPLFGHLDKAEWESIHVRVADYMFSCIELEGREKFERSGDRNFSKKKKYYHKKKHGKKNPGFKEKK